MQTQTQITIAIDQFWGPRRHKMDEALTKRLITQAQVDVFFAAVAEARKTVSEQTINDDSAAIAAFQREYKIALEKIATERGVDMTAQKTGA